MMRRFSLAVVAALLVAPNTFAAPTSPTFYFDDQTHYEREISPGEIHTYVITLRAGEFVRFIADLSGVDVILAFESPDGSPLARVDQWETTADPEVLSAIAPADGRYRLLVRSNWSRPGEYQLRVDDRRAAIPQDRDRIEAERLFSEGEVFRSQRTPEALRAAGDAFDRSLKLFRSLGDDLSASDLLNNIGTVQVLGGSPRDGIDSFLESLALRQCAGDLRPRGGVLSNIAIGLQDLGRDRAAISFSEAALREPNAGSHVRAISTYMLGQAYSKLGEERGALQYYLRALPIAVESGDRAGEGRTLNRIGGSYASLGRWRDALLYYGRALALQREIGNRRSETVVLANLGLLYADWGDTDRALDHYEKSLALSRETHEPRAEAVALHRMGEIYQIRGDEDKAARNFEQALKLYREARYRSDEAMALLGLGRASTARGQVDAALRYYGDALSAAREQLQRAFILTALADAQSRVSRNRDAIVSLNEAIGIFRAAGHQLGEAEALYALGKTKESAGNFDEARDDVEMSLRLIERLRGNISTLEARALFFASYADVSELYIQLLMQLHHRDPGAGFDVRALQASERARARTLTDYLIEPAPAGEGSRQRALIRRQREIRALLSAKAEAQLKAMAGQNPQQLVSAVGREMEELTVEYDQVSAQLQPSGARSATTNERDAIDVVMLRRDVIDPNTALLEYSLGTNKSYVWAVTSGSLRTYELPGRATIDAAVREAYEATTSRSGGAAALEAVSRMILAPALNDITAKRLLIVGDGSLHYLPFAALPSPRNVPRPLIADYEIVSIPSASSIALMRRFPHRSRATKTLAVFADPVFDTRDERVASNERRSPSADALAEDVVRSAQETGLAGGQLPRLPFTRREAEALLALVPSGRGKAALDFQASRKEALGADLANYRIVHFATHGLLNSLHPELSGIVLSLVDRKGTEQRGFVTVSDVLNMSLRADLVVLSGCRTALGKEVKGEGLSGLTRAFMYAGAPRVVASLWKVSDAATAQLMKRFYAAMLGPERMPAAAALRAAQLSVAGEKRWSDPYYWAAFVIQGEWN